MSSQKTAPKDKSDDALEEAKRIMKRLTEMPHKPHKPLGEDGAPTAAKLAKATKDH